MPKMYNPDTQEVRDVRGPQVRSAKNEGFLVVGNRPEEEYLGKSREELRPIEEEEEGEG
jgi:hypothetical protein